VVGKEHEAMRLLVDLVSQSASGVLVVVGTRGRTGLSRLIWGNRAEELVRTAPCSVLVVKETAS
jgi:nucleotide-binding universal stress UspA family protein